MNEAPFQDVPAVHSGAPKPRSKKRAGRRDDGISVYWVEARKEWVGAVKVGYNEKGNPKRKAFYRATKEEARKAATEYKVQIETKGVAPITKDESLGRWLDAWLEEVKAHREPKTHRYYEGFVRLHIKPAIGKTVLRKLTVQDVQGVLERKTGSLASAIHRTLRAALGIAYERGLVETNVATRARAPKVTVKPAEHLTTEEVGKLREAMRGHPLEALIGFTLATGLRVGEATGLTWEHVDLTARHFRVRQQLQRIEGELRLKALKTASSQRTLPLSRSAVEALRIARVGQEVESLDNPLGLVFLNGEGRACDPKYVDEHLKALCAKAGIKPVSFHKLRHTAATTMVAAGVPLHQVMLYLGHSSLALVSTLYAHEVDEAQRLAADVLDDALENGIVAVRKRILARASAN